MGFGSDAGGSVRIPAAFCGITSLKPTSGRIPLQGQGQDGGFKGMVGIFNTLGFMAKSAEDIEDFAELMLSEESVVKVKTDPRFVPIKWNHQVQKKGQKLKIGW